MFRRRGAYGECARSGLRVPLEDLVEDGQSTGLLVSRLEYDPKHPQELAPRLRPERHRMPAPEISRAGDEGVPAPALTFSECGHLTFTGPIVYEGEQVTYGGIPVIWTGRCFLDVITYGGEPVTGGGGEQTYWS
jgi:hypothetical protein